MAPTTSNSNPLGLDTAPTDIETTPEHYNLIGGDPACVGWTRSFDDPHVVQLREKLRKHNGIRGLQVLEPTDVERAAELFHRDGFVVVRDALGPQQLERMRRATERALDEMLAVDPTCAAGGGAGGLPHRYSFGSSSASRHMLHVDEWVELVDMPTTTPILSAIFGSPNYILIGAAALLANPFGGTDECHPSWLGRVVVSVNGSAPSSVAHPGISRIEPVLADGRSVATGLARTPVARGHRGRGQPKFRISDARSIRCVGWRGGGTKGGALTDLYAVPRADFDSGEPVRQRQLALVGGLFLDVVGGVAQVGSGEVGHGDVWANAQLVEREESELLRLVGADHLLRRISGDRLPPFDRQDLLHVGVVPGVVLSVGDCGWRLAEHEMDVAAHDEYLLLP
ncbi:MAG: hypothetical protein ACXV98_17610 [Ilumatobacteraceae bacterium]